MPDVLCKCGRAFEVPTRQDPVPDHLAPYGQPCSGSGHLGKSEITMIEWFRAAILDRPESIRPDQAVESFILEVLDIICTDEREEIGKLADQFSSLSREAFSKTQGSKENWQAYHAGQVDGLAGLLKLKLLQQRMKDMEETK